MTEARVICVAGLGVAAPSLVTPWPIDPEYVLLEIFVLVPSLSISGVPIIQFNNDTGTTNYAFSVSDNGGTPVTGASGAATGIQLAAINSTGAFGARMTIGNGQLSPHAAMFQGLAGALTAASAPHIISGAGVYASTSFISSVQVSSPQGGNLGVGSGLMVIGYIQ